MAFHWHKFSDGSFNDDSDDEFYYTGDSDAIAIGGTLHGLRHLQIVGNQLTNDGLRKILDGCPHLESLDVRYCFNLDLGGELGRICGERIKNLLLPNDSIAGYPYDPAWQHNDSPDYEDSMARSLYYPYDY